MKEVKISPEKLQALLNIISEIPFKYANPLIHELTNIIKENEKQIHLQEAKEDTKELKSVK
jgi:hypothetical protein